MESSNKRFSLKITSVVLSLLVFLTAFSVNPEYFGKIMQSKAISTDYPAQLINISTYDNSKNLSISGTADNSALTVASADGSLSQSWRFDYVGSDSKGTFGKLVNQGSGRLLTPLSYKAVSGQKAVIYGSESDKTQHWYITAVQNDKHNLGLYYKITNYSDTNLALTNNNGTLTLETYSGSNSQKWLLNSVGLQGFAGYCKNDNQGNIKSGDIGGLLGQTVEVTTFADLKKYATSDTPYTIVVTKDIKVTTLTDDSSGNHKYCLDGRINVHSNKTIIGSYNAHTLYNVQFLTSSNDGVGNNVIYKNFDFQHDYKSNGNDSIVVYFRSGKNLWVDHCTFTGHDDYNMLGYNTSPDWDKFLACCYDADYCTVSDCSFGLHEYGIILGYPDSSASNYSKYNGYPRMTLASNKFYKTLTRAPGLMRWGYFHSLNNYVSEFSMAYTVQANVNIFAENCYYENNSTSGNVCCDWNAPSSTDQNLGYFLDTGSESSGKVNRLTAGAGTSSNPSYAKTGTWKASTNYSYKALTAKEAKTYCSTYSGCQSSKDKVNYVVFKSAGVPGAGYTELPGGDSVPVDDYTPATFTDGSSFMIKNVNSGLYMEVADGKAENNANVQQWGADGASAHNTWKLYSAGDGYYYIASCLGDGGTFVLDVAGKKSANGTNLDIYKYNGGTNQQFMLTQNSDGSYKIRTRVSSDKSAVEVINADKSGGANVQQWEVNGANCQDWVLEPVSNIGIAMNTSFVYTFSNVNSGLVMEVVNGTMAEGSNVQQCGLNGYDCQKWVLTAFAGGGNYYYVRSAQDNNYVLLANGGDNGSNIEIAPYSTKNSAMLFKFTKNLDGSYSIMTRASRDARLVEVSGASKNSGANVGQWELNGNSCQNWNISTETTTTTTTAPPVTTTAPVNEVISGDANCDGLVGMADAVFILQSIANPDAFVLTEQGKLNADVVGNDGVTAGDALQIQLLEAGIIDKL